MRKRSSSSSINCSSAITWPPAGFTRQTEQRSICVISLANRRILLKGRQHHPPQQALGWILDLYDNVDEIRAYGQTIVYTIHETVGHLGIFVSGGVAKKEHGEFSSNIDMIDTLPPGLYEAVMENRSEDMASPDLVTEIG